jgi:hypothetical protein
MLVLASQRPAMRGVHRPATVAARRSPALGSAGLSASFASNQPPGRGYRFVYDNGKASAFVPDLVNPTVRLP